LEAKDRVIEDYQARSKPRCWPRRAVGGDSYKTAVPQWSEALPMPKGIVGPWVHKYPHFAIPKPRIGLSARSLRWWDRWLKDIDTCVEDRPRLSRLI